MRKCVRCHRKLHISEFRKWGKKLSKQCVQCLVKSKLRSGKKVEKEIKKGWGHREAFMGDYSDELV